MAEQRQRKLITTPKGIAVWPRLNEPDTKFKPEGVYSVKLRLDAADAEPLVRLITEMAKAELVRAKAEEKNPTKRVKIKAADLPYAEEVGEDEQPTGHVTVNFKMQASGVSKKTGKAWERRPALFDAKGAPLPAGVQIGSGSEIKVAFEASPFTTAAVGSGVSLRLEAVQVIQLRQFEQRDAGAFGFGEEEGGFDAADVASDSPFSAEEGSEAASEGTESDDF